MEEQWIADRAALHALLHTHPDWNQSHLAQHLGRSVSWVKRWRRRLRSAPSDDVQVLWSRSRARHTPPPSTDPLIVERILALRDELPTLLHRTPGPRALQYYLARDAVLLAQGLMPPRSTRTIWQILRNYGRILPRVPCTTEPLHRPPPLLAWQLDFKDASTVPADPDGKRQHVVEVLNTVDTGTSILLDAQVRSDFVADTALEAVAQLVVQHGLPHHVTIDAIRASWGVLPSAISHPPFCAFGCVWVSWSMCVRPTAPISIALLWCITNSRKSNACRSKGWWGRKSPLQPLWNS